MKKILYMLLAIVILSCQKEDDLSTPKVEENELLKKMAGKYYLVKMYTDVPVDLNFDGVYQTNMFVEIDCLHHTVLEWLTSDMVYSASRDHKAMGIYLANSNVYSDTPPLNQCFSQNALVYQIDVDRHTGEFTITGRDEDREAEYGRLTAVSWADDILYAEFSMPIFTSEGWQTVNMFVEYELRYPSNTD